MRERMDGQQTIEGEGVAGYGRLADVVQELQRQRDARVDFVVDSCDLKAEAVPDGVDGSHRIAIVGKTPQVREWLLKPATISDLALPQFGERVGRKSKFQANRVGGRATITPSIPTKFFRELVSVRPDAAAALLTDLLNNSGRRNFVRLLDDNVRAFLSNSYRVLDSYDVAFRALEVARANGGEVVRCSLTDRKFVLQFTSRAVFDAIDDDTVGGMGAHDFLAATDADSIAGGARRFDMPGGPGTVHPLVTVYNSETGHGAYGVKLGLLRAFCCNFVIVEDVVANIHIGGRLDAGIFTPETIAKETLAIVARAGDAIAAAFVPAVFEALVAKAKVANADQIKAPASAVANVVEAAGLTDAAKDSILGYFVAGYRPTRYGLAQAVARYAQDADNADDANAVELLAGRVMVERKLIGAAAT